MAGGCLRDATTIPAVPAISRAQGHPAGSVGGVGATKPGTMLKLGETAHVKWNSLDRDATYDVDATAVKIEEPPATTSRT